MVYIQLYSAFHDTAVDLHTAVKYCRSTESSAEPDTEVVTLFRPYLLKLVDGRGSAAVWIHLLNFSDGICSAKFSRNRCLGGLGRKFTELAQK